MPASSHCLTRSRLFSQLLSQRSATFVTAMPLEQFAENVPSLSRFWLNMGAEECGMSFPCVAIVATTWLIF